MKLISYRWHKLYRSNPQDWTAESLADASLDELEALSRLMGIAHSGTKTQRISRLLMAAHVRTVLASWGEADTHEQVHALAARLMPVLTGKELSALCRWADLPHYTTKRAMIILLLNWRNECRRKGQRFNQELKTAPCTLQHRMF